MIRVLTLIILYISLIGCQKKYTTSNFEDFCSTFHDKVDLDDYMRLHTFENNMALDGREFNFSGIKTAKDIYCNTTSLDSLLIKYPEYVMWNENHPLSHRLNDIFKQEKFKFYKDELESTGYAITNGVYFDIISKLRSDLKREHISIKDAQLILYVSNTLYYDFIISGDRIKC